MRIHRLDLTRFGLFTDATLDLSRPGTHLVLGHNEAGKTTAMAAIEQLLYGIPVRTNHAFVHEMRDLRLGALLADDGGETLEIVRVKKQANTLQNLDGTTIEEAKLAKLLHDVSEEVYTSLFAIGHEEIVAGGEALLDSDGEVGRALFSASRSTTDLNAVMRRLDERANQLFKNSATKPLLNAAIKGYKDATSEARALSMSASEVVGLDRELATAQKSHDVTADARLALASRRTLLQQTRAARPLLLARDGHMANRTQLEAEGPLVDVEMRSQLEEAKTRRSEGESDLRATKAAIERLDEKLSDLKIDTNLLDQQEKVEKLTSQTGGYEEKEEDLPGLKVRATTIRRELEQLGKKLPAACPLDDSGQSALTVDQQERIRELATARTSLDSDQNHASKALEEAITTLTVQQAELSKLDEPTDVAALMEVIARIRKAGDLEATRTETSRKLADLDAELTGQLATLGLTNADSRAVDAIAVPSLELIRRTRDDTDARSATMSSVDHRIGSCDARLAALTEELAQLLRSEEPPTADDLTDSRARRDAGWNLIRGAWLDGAQDKAASDLWSAGRPLPEAYEAAVVDSDEIADRLRREAEAVERRASLEGQIAALEAEAAEHQTEREDARGRPGFGGGQMGGPLGTPRRPGGRPGRHGGLVDDFRTCAQQSEKARTLDGQIIDLGKTITRHRTDLMTSLANAGGPADAALSLQGLLDHADQFATNATESAQQFRNATDSVRETEVLATRRRGTLAAANDALDAWTAEWAGAIAVIGLTADASPNEASAVLEALTTIDTKGKDHEDLERRISGINDRSKTFTDGLAAVLEALEVDDDVADADPASAVKMLGRRLSEAQAEATKQTTTLEERETQDQAAAKASQLVADAEAAIAELVGLADLADEEALVAAITRSEQLVVLADQIHTAENSLQNQAGKPVAQVEADAAELDGVEIEPEIEQLDIELGVLDQELKQKQIAVGELKNQRAQIDSSGAAADQMVRAQQSLAEVVDYAEEYVRTVLAKRLLEEQVASYRDENQGPLLQRARGLFRDLTLGRYTGLDTDTDDKGVPLLLARKADDRLLEISALSTGTRDQLYLALRLAALEQFMARRGPLPLVLDDLFVHFDDERTKAALECSTTSPTPHRCCFSPITHRWPPRPPR
ncbi:MAG: AAA family ATPase [Candidatus Microthrix sp.]|nr:YhaN family protein [Candidatus Microthrix sp.]MBK7322590.1 AAA family ATPase [Candidatus Microthrix sp.]